MKRINIMMVFTVFFAVKALAQKSITSTLINSYSHTVTYSWGKAVFHLLPFGKEIRYTNLEKIYFWYSGNVINNTQGGFSGHLLDGDYAEYYSNKNLKVQGTFKTGLKHGIWRNWSEDGMLKSVHNYESGSLNGEFKEYGDSGKVLQFGKYKKGVLNGKLYKYAGDSVIVEKYDHGKLVLPQPSWMKKNLTKFFRMIKNI